MKKIFNLLLITSLMIGFTSCLKDEQFDNHIIGHQVDDQKIIELARANNASTSRTISFDYVDRDTIVALVPVRIASGVPAPHDITVTLDTAISATLISGTELVRLPLSYYTHETPLSVVIPKGQTEAWVKIKINPIRFNASNTYAIGFKITSVSDPSYKISQNYSTYLVRMGAKNKYDGVYSLRVRMDAPDRPTVLTGTAWDWGGNVHLVTVGASTVDLYDDWGFGDYIQPIRTAAGAALSLIHI